MISVRAAVVCTVGEKLERTLAGLESYRVPTAIANYVTTWRSAKDSPITELEKTNLCYCDFILGCSTCKDDVVDVLDRSEAVLARLTASGKVPKTRNRSRDATRCQAAEPNLLCSKRVECLTCSKPSVVQGFLNVATNGAK